MGRSQTFDLIAYLFAPVWEQKKGRKYRGTGRDMAEAKTFLTMNPDCMDESDFIVEFQEHILEYLEDAFEGWKSQDYPAWAFLRNYNQYEPQKRGVAKVAVILCSDCMTKGTRTIHAVDKLCPKCNP